MMTIRWNLKAIFFGAVVDIGGSLIVGAAVMLAASVILGTSGANPEQISSRLQGKGMGLVSALIGTAFTAIGGYVAGRVSKLRELQHALASAVPCFALGFLLGGEIASLPGWYLAFFYVTLFPAAAVGGFLAQSRNRSQALRTV